MTSYEEEINVIEAAKIKMFECTDIKKMLNIYNQMRIWNIGHHYYANACTHERYVELNNIFKSLRKEARDIIINKLEGDGMNEEYINNRISEFDFKDMYNAVIKCKSKAELVDVLATYKILNHTERTGVTKNGKDLYIAFRDNYKKASHILMQETSMRLYTMDYISDDDYFAGIEFNEIKSDGYRNRAASFDLTEANFKFLICYFLRYKNNWIL